MAKRTDILSIVEAAYRPAESRETWALGVVGALSEALDGVPCGALIFDATNPRWVNLDWSWTSGIPEAAAKAAFNIPVPGDDGSSMVKVYRSITFTSVRKSVTPAVPQIGQCWTTSVSRILRYSTQRTRRFAASF